MAAAAASRCFGSQQLPPSILFYWTQCWMSSDGCLGGSLSIAASSPTKTGPTCSWRLSRPRLPPSPPKEMNVWIRFSKASTPPGSTKTFPFRNPSKETWCDTVSDSYRSDLLLLSSSCSQSLQAWGGWMTSVGLTATCVTHFGIQGAGW